jgi:hypothetical protein
MSLKANIKTIRDYLVTQTKSAWSGVTVSHEPSELTDATPTAMINLTNVSLEAETVGVDMARLRFDIVGRFAKVSNLSDAMIDRATDLRVALLATVNPGSVGYLTTVSEVLLTQEDGRDGFYEIGVAFECMVSAPRS